MRKAFLVLALLIPFMGVFAAFTPDSVAIRQDSVTAVTEAVKQGVAVSSTAAGSLASGGNVIDTTLSSGITFTGLLRGLLGMAVILAIAWVFSRNRRAINWKVVLIGLTFQILLAAGILYVPFIMFFFEFVGKIFVKILDFTKEGSIFQIGRASCRERV